MVGGFVPRVVLGGAVELLRLGHIGRFLGHVTP